MLEKICREYNVDKVTMNRMLFKILREEKRNLNTKKYTGPEMVEKLTEILKEEVRKCF